MAPSSSSYAILTSLRNRSSSLRGFASCSKLSVCEDTRVFLDSLGGQNNHTCISKNGICGCCIKNRRNLTEGKKTALTKFLTSAPNIGSRLSRNGSSNMRTLLPSQHAYSQRLFLSSLAETEEKQESSEDAAQADQSTNEQSSLPLGPTHVNPDNAASYVLMSNIYADGGKWDEVKRINEMRIQARAWKKPGKAWIECKSKVHEFIVGDETHQESAHIYEKIKKMRRHMNHTGYVPNVELVLQNRSNYDPFKPK